MKDKALTALHDILDAITEARDILGEMDLRQYRNDNRTRRAIERLVEIASEASRRVPDDLKQRETATPWHEIAAIGNRLRHEYQRVDDAIIWDIASRHFDELGSAVERLIAHIKAENAQN